MNYGELRTNFVSLLNRRDLTPSLRDSFLQMGIARVQRALRVPAMEKSIEVTWAANTQALPIPDDYLQLIELSAGDTTLVRKDTQTVRRAMRGTGCPKVFARQGGVWIIGPKPQIGDVLRIDYYAEFPALSEDSDSNFLSSIASDVVLNAALVYGAGWALDERKDGFEADTLRGIDDLTNQSLRDELTGSAEVAPAIEYPEDW